MKKLQAFVLLAVTIAVSCAPAATPTPVATRPPAPAATSTPTRTATQPPSALATPTPQPTPSPTSAAPPSAGKPSGTLVVAFPTFGNEVWYPWELRSLNSSIVETMTDALLYRDHKTMEYGPGLAERWAIAPDAQSITLYLRQGVQWHEGYGELTADDVKFAIEEYLRPESKSSNGEGLKLVVAKVEVPDKYTVTLRFKGPINMREQLLYHISIPTPNGGEIYPPKKYVDAVGRDEAGRRPIGSGPFRFIRHTPGVSVELEALDSHWRKTPYYKKLVFKKIPETFTALASLYAGQVDIVNIPPSFVKEAKARGQRIINVQLGGTHTIFLGGQYPERPSYDPTVPWALPDKERALKVRKALNLAVDRQAILDTVMEGYGTLVPVMGFAEGQPWTLPSLKPYPYRPDEARRLLAEAGYPQGFKLDMLAVPDLAGRPELPDIAEAVASYWQKNLGLTVSIRPTQWVTARQLISEFRTSWMVGTYSFRFAGREPAGGLRSQFYSKQTGGHLTGGGAEDPGIDRLMTGAYAELDYEKRLPILRDLGQYLYDNYFAVPVLAAGSFYAVSKKVGQWPIPPQTVDPELFEYIAPSQ